MSYGVVWEAADGEGFHEGCEVREGAHRRPKKHAAAPARGIAEEIVYVCICMYVCICIYVYVYMNERILFRE